MKENQYFHTYHPKVTKIGVEGWRKVIAAFKEDGAIVIDGRSGEFRNMNYMIGDIRKGDSSSGARHRAASAVAQTGCWVVKASEEVTKAGHGNVSVFQYEKTAVEKPVKNKTDKITNDKRKQIAVNMLIDAGEHDGAIDLLEKWLRSPDEFAIKERAALHAAFARALHAKTHLGPTSPTKGKEKNGVSNKDPPPVEELSKEMKLEALNKALDEAQEAGNLYLRLDVGLFDQADRARTLSLFANLCAAVATSSGGCDWNEAVLEDGVKASERAVTILRELDHEQIGDALRTQASLSWARCARSRDFKYGQETGPSIGKDGTQCLRLNHKSVQAYEAHETHKSDSGYARAMKMVGRFYHACGRLEEARDWYESSVAAYDEIQGPLHVWSARYREDLATLFEELKRADEADHVRKGKHLQSKRPDISLSMENENDTEATPDTGTSSTQGSPGALAAGRLQADHVKGKGKGKGKEDGSQSEEATAAPERLSKRDRKSKGKHGDQNVLSSGGA